MRPQSSTGVEVKDGCVGKLRNDLPKLALLFCIGIGPVVFIYVPDEKDSNDAHKDDSVVEGTERYVHVQRQ